MIGDNHPPWDFTSPKSSNFPEMEKRILDFWKQEDIFAKTLNKKTSSTYTFYDGPPFANGLPHYGHLATGYVKDIIPRYQTMRGQCVPRRFGWDCHGLPAELEAEKNLALSGRQEIIANGLDAFNQVCRTSVLRYTKEWEDYVHKQGRWVDVRGAYKTMDLSYMESVIWAFKRLYDKGLVYRDYRVVPYSWKVQTSLSHFETRLDESYRMRQDHAIIVDFPLEESAESLWIWTTTPWTIPANLAVAINPDLTYVVVEAKDGKRGIMSASSQKRYGKAAKNTVVGEYQGKALIGKKYRPPFDFFKSHPNAFQILSGDFVTEEDGTGIVHLAPAFGEDDMACCAKNNISIVMPIDDAARFTKEVAPWEGMQVFEANKPIIRALKEKGLLIRNETIDHSYPHCWRTDTPLIYKAVDSWYVKVTALKERMCQLNQLINWVPSHIKDGLFGKWLAGAYDWNISRSRFWGTPIPVWLSDDAQYPRVDVYGSLAELQKDFGLSIDDLHLPGIDQLTRRNPDDPTGKSMMRRVPDVLDCWFESGSMPFASMHYPFDQTNTFKEHFPADFIVEYTAQTRGWFYTLMVLSTALFDNIPFKNCLCHGVVLDNNKQKLSKRLKNYADPKDVFHQYGADTLRWRMASSSLFIGGNLHLDKNGKDLQDAQNKVLRPLWSAIHFYSIYSASDNIKGQSITAPHTLINRYLLWKLEELSHKVTESFDSYRIPSACAAVEHFLDVLNNWYIRRQRPLFWQDKNNKNRDKIEAYDTLYTALKQCAVLVAPLLPFLADAIYIALEGKSVHLASWLSPSIPKPNPSLQAMDDAREICSIVRRLREQSRIRVRQPLDKVVIVGEATKELMHVASYIKEEVNVKKVEFTPEDAQFFEYKIVLSKNLLRTIPVNEQKNSNLLQKYPTEAQEKLVFLNIKGFAGASYRNMGILLDISLSKELCQEGDKNDLIRQLQKARKEEGLPILSNADAVILCSDPQRLKDVIEQYKEEIEKVARIKKWIIKGTGITGENNTP